MKRFPAPLIIVWLLVGVCYSFLVWNYQVHQKERAPDHNEKVTQSIAPKAHDSVERTSTEKDRWEQETDLNEETFFEKSKRLKLSDHIAQINMAIAAWIGVLLGIFGSFLLMRTLMYTRDAANSAADALVVARDANAISQNNVEFTQSMMIETERARIISKEVEINIMYETNPKSLIGVLVAHRWKNVGKTEGVNCTIEFQISAVENIPDPILAFKFGKYNDGSTRFTWPPDNTQLTPVHVEGALNMRMLSNVYDGKTRLFLWSGITYSSIFQRDKIIWDYHCSEIRVAMDPRKVPFGYKDAIVTTNWYDAFTLPKDCEPNIDNRS